MRYFIGFVILTLLGGAAFLAARNGIFQPVEFVVEERGPYLLLSKQHIGPYHKILSTLQEVEAWAKASKLDCTVTFGEFIDDPAVVEHERLRSNVGCVLDKAPSSVTLPEAFQFREFPLRKYLIGKFSGSPALGPYKVYGKVADILRERGLTPESTTLEIYTPVGDKDLETSYLFPVRESALGAD